MSLNPGRSFSVSLLVGFSLWLLVTAGSVRPVGADGWDPARVSWEQLLFEASSSLGRVAARVELGLPAAEDMKLDPGDGGQGPLLLPEQGTVLLLSAGIDASLLLQRKHWTGRVWFLAEQGSALQRTRVKPGREGSLKLFRYGRDGVYRKRFDPKGRKEATLPPEEWSRIKTSFYPYATGSSRCEQVLDPLTLLYVLSVIDWSAETELEFCLFNKKGLYLARLKNEGRERTKVAFWEQRGASNQPVEREVDAWNVLLTSRPLDPVSKDLDPFEFLGFESEVRILLGVESGVPLRLTGEIPSVGLLTLNLTKAVLIR